MYFIIFADEGKKRKQGRHRSSSILISYIDGTGDFFEAINE